MQITNTLSMVLSADDSKIIVRNGEGLTVVYKDKDLDRFSKFRVEYIRLRNMPTAERATADLTTLLALLETTAEGLAIADGLSATPTERLALVLGKLISFFTEFQFEPNFRFVNSLSHALQLSPKEGTDYICNYFELTDNPYKRELGEKIKSAEFKSIAKEISNIAPQKTVNTRFKVYYGSQGTGKTTKAMEETCGRCIVCNSSMLPSDLMEDFVFVDGKATFQPSALWRSMVDGTKITLDEINLLPFDSLRFLQTILDGKKEFLYKGHRVEIADGFQIIGTMNLTVNGMTYGLPEPLIDRASEMQKFVLTAEQLVNAIM